MCSLTNVKKALVLYRDNSPYIKHDEKHFGRENNENAPAR